MKIGIYISELLFDHESVILPGFGMFSTEYKPARFIPEEKKVESPSRVITFDGEIKEGQTPLFDHVAKRESVTQEEVEKYIGDFVDHLNQSLNSGTALEVQKIGIFSKTSQGKIVFEPDLTVNYLVEASGLNSVKEPEKSQEASVLLTPASRMNNDQKKQTPKKQETPEQEQPKMGSALRWVAYTVVPLLIIAIIVGFNYQYIFGNGGLLRPGSKSLHTHQTNVIIEETSWQEQASIEETPTATSVEELAEPELKPQPGRKVYYIVVGSFENHHQAEVLVEDLKKQGAELADIFMKTPAGFYRVSYGFYYELKQAEQQLLAVQQNVNPNAWILHR
jgi:nucleoid DNA-binding protein